MAPEAGLVFPSRFSPDNALGLLNDFLLARTSFSYLTQGDRQRKVKQCIMKCIGFPGARLESTVLAIIKRIRFRIVNMMRVYICFDYRYLLANEIKYENTQRNRSKIVWLSYCELQ